MMRTIPVGHLIEQYRKLHGVYLQAMAARESALRLGNNIGEVFDAYTITYDNTGMQKHRLNAT